MSLPWTRRCVTKDFPSGGRSLPRIKPPSRCGVRLAVEALEDRCLLDAGGLGNVGLGLRDIGFIFDINTQIQALQNPAVAAQQPLGYLFSDVGNLLGDVVSSIPGADTGTIGQAITTAADLGRLAWLIKSNAFANTQATNAMSDFESARFDIQNAINAYAAKNYQAASDFAVQANTWDLKGANATNSIEVTPATEPVVQALLDMYHLNNDDVSVYYVPGQFAADTPQFNADAAYLTSNLPWSSAALTAALSDVLALAGDISSLAGGPVGGIVGDALQTTHDALNLGLDFATDQDTASDFAQLAGDGTLLLNDTLAASNPANQPLSVSATLPSGASSLQSGTIATFSDPNVPANQAAPPASDYTAYISWGDGSSSQGQIAAGSGNATYTVTGNHLYTTPGNYAVSVVVAGNGAQGQGSENTTINVNNGGTLPPVQGITVAGQNLTTQGSQTVSGSIATVYAPASGTYTAVINWGDGTTSTGQVVAGPNGTFSVTGSHSYSQSGGYLTNVQVSDSSGNVASAFGSVITASPTSTVAPLPAVQTSPTFTVSWSGSDAGGPGIASFNVYVSDNGGAFTPLLQNTTQTSTTFAGQVGHTYAFYSVAADQLGITQPTPAAAQATTTVQAPSAPPSSPPSAPPGSPPPAASPPPSPLSALDQLFIEVEQIVANIEAEIQQLVNAELAIVSNLFHSTPRL
ncbi:MAG TPA: hypothetical protein VMG10_16950 [Gemmataceae bacterium]|nr:hypothetical protein [Gemmataceae bacterium]